MSHLQVVVFDPESLVTDDQAAALASGGYHASRTTDPAVASATIERDSPAALVIVEGRDGPGDGGPLASARARGIPVLGILRPDGDSATLGERAWKYDDWTHHASTPLELPVRLKAQLAGPTPPAAPGLIPIDRDLLATIVHDIRNPLNVIGLTLRVIDQSSPEVTTELGEDLGFLRDNAWQIEKMLTLLSEFCRLHDHSSPLAPMRFETARFLDDLLQERAGRANEKVAYPARFEPDPSAPKSVVLDPTRARLAVVCALANAAGATDRPLTVFSSGTADRWRISIRVNRPPPATVHSELARDNVYERLVGSAAERKGLDLALASWISRQFGGSVRIEVVPDAHSSIVIDWPTHSA